MRTASLLILALSLAAALGFGAPAAAESRVITVCPGCAIAGIDAALALAQPGDRIDVRGGVYPGGLVIDRDVQLIGSDGATIDGGGSGTVIHITGGAVLIQGFTIRGSGASLDHEDAAILAENARVEVLDNRIEDSLFGIYLKQAHGSVIRGNTIIAKPLEIAMRGDGIRVWYCDDVVIENNIARDGRDVILWYSNRGLVRGNAFDRGRYGLHLMFSDAATIVGNSLRANSIGLYVMYSRDPYIAGNSLSDNHGPSGGGLGLKDVDRAVVEGNRFIDNQIGAQVDTSPRESGIENYFIDNVFAFNQVGIAFQPSVRHNTLAGNSFVDNAEHVAILGGGALREITWQRDGRGNYWSDYAGYDADGDGVGDIPYRSERLFESLMDRHPSFRLFQFSPAALAIDFAARAFPSVRPETKFEDSAPLMEPPFSALLPPVERAGSTSRLALGGAGGLAVAAVLAALVALRPSRLPGTRQKGSAPMVHDGQDRITDGATRPRTPGVAIDAAGLTKRYGRVTAVDHVTFRVHHGEAVALWGPNGAGKTTILRCLLGLARFDGRLDIGGLDPRVAGRDVRATIGFVPQDLPVTAVTVRELSTFIARLKGRDAAAAIERLELLGIADQLDKAVGALSGGMKQRLALALALIGAPTILLLDEPTANLDARGRAELLQLLRGLKQEGLTILFSSHRPEDVLFLADRVLLVERGRIEADLRPDAFVERLSGSSRLVLYLANGHREEAIETLARLGYQPSGEGKVLSVAVPPHEKARVLGALARNGVDLDDFEVERGL